MKRETRIHRGFLRAALALILATILFVGLTPPLKSIYAADEKSAAEDAEALFVEHEDISDGHVSIPDIREELPDGKEASDRGALEEGSVPEDYAQEDSLSGDAVPHDEEEESSDVPQEEKASHTESVDAVESQEDNEAIALLSVKTVTTFAEFRAAVLDLTVDTIELGNNIVLTSQIIIPPTKGSLTIDGQGQYTLEQAGGGTALYSAAAIGASYTLQNMTFVGRDYYGVIACAASSLCPTIYINNMVYSGPQMIYNPYGSVVYSGVNDILIQANATNSNGAQEAAEVHNVSISGSFNLRFASTASSCFWIYGGVGTPTFTIEEGATATFTALNKMSSRGFFWISSYVNVTVSDNASLIMNLTGNNPLCTDTSHRIQTLTIGNNATAVFNCAGGIVIQDSISVQQGATVMMNYLTVPGSTGSAYSYPLLAFYGSANSTVMNIDRPQSLVLAVQPTARPIFTFNSAATMSFTTTDFNYWNSYSNAAANAKPTSMWYSASKNTFTAGFSMNSGNDSLKTLVSSDAAFASAFKPASARVIQVGTDALPLAADQIWDYATQATGTTAANAAVYVDYVGTDQVSRSYSGTSDSSGAFAVDIVPGPLSSAVNPLVVAVSGFMAAHGDVTVLEADAPSADPVLQYVEKGTVFTSDGLSLLTNVSTGGGSAVTATVTQEPDVNTVGMSSALVTLTNGAGKSVQVTVSVFVYDQCTSFNEDKTLALRTEHFTVYSNEFPEKAVLGDFILERSNARAWDLSTGEDISGRIAVQNDALENILDTQSVTVSVESLSRVVMVTVIDTAQWIHVRMPTSMLFGTLDVYPAGKITSPRYEIENLSEHDVSIGLGGFGVTKSDGVALLTAGNGVYGTSQLKLSLNLDEAVAVEYLQPYTNSAAKTPLKTLEAGETSIATFSGTYYGMFPAMTPLQPQYLLVWSFEAETGE